MKKTITICICMMMLGGSAMAQNYQIPNSDFEIWNDVNEPGNGWYSFVSANATDFIMNIGKNTAKKNTIKVDGRTGSAIQIASTTIAGAKANGNLTSGRINMGSMSPANAANHNFTNRSESTTNNNCSFVGLPDSVSCWAIFSRGENTDYVSQGNFVLHGDINYKDPHETEANVAANRVAGGTIKIAPSTTWTYFSAPMEYTEVEAAKMYMLGSFTTNPTPGGSAGDKLQIDDVAFIYNSKLASLSINDIPLERFDKNTYTYVLKDELPSEGAILAVSDGKGAKVNIQKGDDVVKIIVTGNDGVQNQHIYSLVKEGTIFGATSIKLNDVEMDGFDSKVFSYENLQMSNGVYPIVSVTADPNFTLVDMQLNEAEQTITIVVTDLFNNIAYTYILKFTPSDKVINGPQIKGDFEKQTPWGPEGFEEPSRWGTVADGWASSNVTQMGFLNFVMVEKESYGESNAVKMINGRPGLGNIASNAPGYITLGAPWVYADMAGLFSTQPGYTGVPDTDDSDGGTIGGVNFTYQPDSIVGYYKRTYVNAESELVGLNPNEEAKIIAYLWKGTSTSMTPTTDGFNLTGSAWQLLVDREIDILGTKNNGTPADGITLIASAEETVKELADWTRLSVPLNYVSNEKPEKANVVISSADYFNRGNIGNGNTLSADDVKFIYNSKLSSLSISGTPLESFNKEVYMYTLDELPAAESDIVAVADGKGALVDIKVGKTFIKITVTGNDGVPNQHIYTLVKKGATFSATSINLNDVELDGFDSAVNAYEDLAMPNGIYPTVSVASDPTLTSVDMQLNDATKTVTIVVTDKVNDADQTYTLKFTSSDKIANGSQIKGDFEVQAPWKSDMMDKERLGTVADGWFSSNVTQMGSMNFVMVEKESHQVGEDLYAVKAVNGRPGLSTAASNAPGYITLGTPWVYADVVGLLTETSDAMPVKNDKDDSDGGTIGGVRFTYQPDSIVGYYKRTYADEASGLAGMNPKEDAKIIAYLWKGTSASMAPATAPGFESFSATTGSNWQLLVDRDIDILGTKNNGTSADGITLIASAEETVKELADWTRLVVPLNYVSDEKPEKANVVISSADYFNRVNIGNGNTLSADDVKFIYNSKLASVTIDGVALDGFAKDVYAYELDGTAPAEGDIVAVVDGKGATVEVAINGKIVTIRVKGNDIAENASNLHTYTLTFKFATGIDQNVENTVSVKGIANGAIVEGAQLGERVEVYSVQGVLVGQYTVNGTLNINGLNSNTVYLVKIGSYVTRILTK